MRRYRLVADYGFGDKTWVARLLSAEDAVKAFNKLLGGDVIQTIEQALDYEHPVYSVEADAETDEEDWDWGDS